MNFWKILKIEPTTDINIIKKAYAEAVKSCHPEEDPKGFLELRKAYDYAINYANFKNSSKAMSKNPKEEDLTLSIKTTKKKQRKESEIRKEDLDFLNGESNQKESNEYDYSTVEELYQKEIKEKALQQEKAKKEFQRKQKRKQSTTHTIIAALVILANCIFAFMGSNNKPYNKITIPDAIITPYDLYNQSLLNMDSLHRKQTSNDILSGVSYANSTAAALLKIPEEEYNFILREVSHYGKEYVDAQLENYRPEETFFVTSILRPEIKRNVLLQTDYITIAYKCSILNITQEDYIYLLTVYNTSGEQALNESLEKFDSVSEDFLNSLLMLNKNQE